MPESSPPPASRGLEWLTGLRASLARAAHEPRELWNLLPAAVGALALGAVLLQLVLTSSVFVTKKKPLNVPVAAPPVAQGVELTPALGALFGAKASTADVEVAPAVPLVLTAVIATADPTAGFGILGPTAQSTTLYHAGAEIPGGARLIEVYLDRVILDRNGAREVLRLPQSTLAATAVAEVSAPVAEVVHVPARKPRTVPDWDKILKAREQINSTAGRTRAWFAQMGAAVKRGENGEVVGLAVHPSGPLKHNSPLRPGDILVAVDGTPVSTSDDAIQSLAKDFQRSSTITVMRNGAPMTMSLSVGPPP